MKKDPFGSKFSETDRALLWEHIRKEFGRDKASAFIDWMEVRCSMFMLLKTKESRIDHQKRLRMMIENFKQSQKYLDEIGRPFDPFPQRTFADLAGKRAGEIMDLNFRAQEHREEPFRSLQKVIDVLETALKEQPIKGEVKGKSISFIRVIAADYETILKRKPTWKRNSHFVSFIQKLFSILKLSFSDPRKTIKSAIKTPQT